MNDWKPNANQISAAAEIARRSPLPLDRLPYTPAFDYLFEQLVTRVGELTRNQAWHCFTSARKRGLLKTRRRRKKDQTPQ